MAYRGTARGSGPGDELWERKTREQVREAINDKQFRIHLSEADIILLRDKNFATPGRRLDHPADVIKTAREMLIQTINHIPGSSLEGKFSSVLAALETAKQDAWEWNANGFAAQREIFNTAYEADLDLANPVDLAATINELGKREFLSKSAEGREQEKQLQDAARKELEKATLRASIMQGRKSTYEKWDGKEGKIIYIDKESLERRANEDDDAHLSRLAQIDRDVSDLRRNQNGTRGDQRQNLRQIADSNKEHRIYRPGDTDTLDRDAVSSHRSSDDASPIKARVDIRNYQANAKVDYTGPRSGNESATAPDPFISKTSGCEITKAEAYGFAKNDLETFRKLTNKDSKRLNRILRGE
jgi:hypothetical protein